DLEVAEEERQPERLAEHVPVLVEDRDRAVLALVDDRGVGAADQRGVHVLRAGDEGVPDDLGRDRVDDAGLGSRDGLGHAAPPFVISMFPWSSMRARWPGGTTVVELSSSITAGPL